MSEVFDFLIGFFSVPRDQIVLKVPIYLTQVIELHFIEVYDASFSKCADEKNKNFITYKILVRRKFRRQWMYEFSILKAVLSACEIGSHIMNLENVKKN